MPERRLSTSRIVSGVKDRLRIMLHTNVWGAQVEGSEMSESDRLRRIPGTKAHFDAPIRKKKPWPGPNREK